MKECQQDIERSEHRGQERLDVGRQAMMNALEIAHDGHHGQSSLDTLEAQISQDNALPVHLLNHRMEVLIMDIHGTLIPGDDFALTTRQPT